MSVDKESKVQEWETPLKLAASQIQAYQNEGVAKIKNFFSDDSLHIIRHEILGLLEKIRQQEGEEDNEEDYPSEDIDLYRKAFTQVFNLWTHSEIVRSVVFGRLADVAAKLMGVDGVRIYHDQALFKEPGGVATPWHMDHYYWPLASEKVLTAWIPLIPVSAAMGPLDFALGSQVMGYGRNNELVQQDEKITESKLAEAGYEIAISPYEAGEVSFHQGWVFHRAGANQTDRRREVFTVIYMDQDMALNEPANSNQQYDREKWCPGVEVGEVIATDINPLVPPL